MRPGLFITFEGIDFSGKTTQAELLCERLRQRGLRVLLLRDPGGTRISERIRDLLLDVELTEMHPVTELLLYEAARAQMVAEKIIPALERGEVVVCDRFYDSTTAYQGFGRRIPLQKVRKANELGSLDLAPDLTFYLDLPVDEALERRKGLKVEVDRLEREDRDFAERVRAGYLELARSEKRVVVIDGGGSAAEIAADIWSRVEELASRRGLL